MGADHECPLRFGAWLRRTDIDWLCPDARYWKALIKKAKDEGIWVQIWPRHTTGLGPIYRQDYGSLRKAIRNERFQHKTDAAQRHLQTPMTQYGEKIGAWVWARLGDAVAACGDRCVDNHRWARVSKQSDTDRYKTKKARAAAGAMMRKSGAPSTVKST